MTAQYCTRAMKPDSKLPRQPPRALCHVRCVFTAPPSALDDTAQEPSSGPSIVRARTDRLVVTLSWESQLDQMVAHNKIIGRGQHVWLCRRCDANGWCVGE